MTITENAVEKLVNWLKERPDAAEAFITDAGKRRDYMENLLDTECGAEVSGDAVRFDLGCAQPIVPYAVLEKAVWEALRAQ